MEIRVEKYTQCCMRRYSPECGEEQLVTGEFVTNGDYIHAYSSRKRGSCYDIDDDHGDGGNIL